jgi:hypothetical protein
VAGDIVFLSSPQAGARGLSLVPNGDAIARNRRRIVAVDLG